jgi:hypothetical protein
MARGRCAVTAVVLGCAAVVLILGGVAAIAWSMLGGHRIRCLPRVIACRVAWAVLRVRWAWRCRRHPPVDSPHDPRDPLVGDDLLAFLHVMRGWKHTASRERTRT